jgi:glycerol-3-phosphate acyltransferase PlsX
MNIGTEEGKGSALITETNELLKRMGNIINYSGPIEGFHVFTEHVDVVVCDGFVGNIMIKSWESLVRFFSNMLKEELQANPMRATGALLSKGAFNALKERINPERYGGAPLLGLNGNIFKAHGSSNRRAIRSAIIAANEMVRAEMNLHIETDLARANELLARPVFS